MLALGRFQQDRNRHAFNLRKNGHGTVTGRTATQTATASIESRSTQGEASGLLPQTHHLPIHSSKSLSRPLIVKELIYQLR